MHWPELKHLDLSDKILLASNLATIGLAVLLQWGLLTIMGIYWLQSIIIGFFVFIRILMIGLRNAEHDPVGVFFAGFLAFFFALHYGGFHVGYLFFLFAFISMGEFGIPIPMDYVAVAIAGVFFLISHGFSFLRYALAEADKPIPENDSTAPPFKIAGSMMEIGPIMAEPYARIIPMHLTIMFGMVLIMFFGGTGHSLAVLLFMILKTGVDLQSHQKIHAAKTTNSKNHPFAIFHKFSQ